MPPQSVLWTGLNCGSGTLRDATLATLFLVQASPQTAIFFRYAQTVHFASLHSLKLPTLSPGTPPDFVKSIRINSIQQPNQTKNKAKEKPFYIFLFHNNILIFSTKWGDTPRLRYATAPPGFLLLQLIINFKLNLYFKCLSD